MSDLFTFLFPAASAAEKATQALDENSRLLNALTVAAQNGLLDEKQVAELKGLLKNEIKTDSSLVRICSWDGR
jgi:hypothetical protein